jgi:hypothetical protein
MIDSLGLIRLPGPFAQRQHYGGVTCSADDWSRAYKGLPAHQGVLQILLLFLPKIGLMIPYIFMTAPLQCSLPL